MGNVESRMPDNRAPVAPDGNGRQTTQSNHGLQVKEVGEKLMDVHESVRSLSESGAVSEGVLLEVSTKLKDAFKEVESIEREAALNGACNVGFAVLAKQPGSAEMRPVCEMLFDRRFCIALCNVKVELIRINRGEPHSGPWLTGSEVRWLESWGDQLVEGAMRTWATFFRSLSWPRAWAFCPEDDTAAYDVPDRFRTLVCNLVWMRLNLWPKIKHYLDEWKVKGQDIFPVEYWTDEYLSEVLSVEPRMIPYIVGADKIDMSELAHRGPGLRSGEAHRDAVQALNENGKLLVQAGVACMRANNVSRFKKQRPAGGRWKALQYKWPREDMPRARDLMGGTAWACNNL